MKKLPQLMQELVNNQVPHYNIFTGEEIAVQKIYIDKILDEYKRVDCDSVAQALQKSRTKSLTGSNRAFIVVDDNLYMKDEKAWEIAQNAFTKASKNILIIIYSNIDKRSKKFLSKNDEYIVSFDRLSDDVLVKYIQKDINLSDETAQKLVKLCESDYSRILLEIDKITSYARVFIPSSDTIKSEFADKCFEELLKQGVIYQPIGDITFKLTDAVLRGELDTTEKYLKMAIEKEESPILVLSVLYTGFHNMLMVMDLGSNKKDASKRTGLTPFQVGQATKNIGGYKQEEVKRALFIIQDVESGIKTGKYDMETAMQYAILEIMR